MAREVVTRCDVNPADAGDDVRTYTIRIDGHTWEVDLCDKHAEPLRKLLTKGREVAAPQRSRDLSKTLDGMVRNPPEG